MIGHRVLKGLIDARPRLPRALFAAPSRITRARSEVLLPRRRNSRQTCPGAQEMKLLRHWPVPEPGEVGSFVAVTITRASGRPVERGDVTWGSSGLDSWAHRLRRIRDPAQRTVPWPPVSVRTALVGLPVSVSGEEHGGQVPCRAIGCGRHVGAEQALGNDVIVGYFLVSDIWPAVVGVSSLLVTSTW